MVRERARMRVLLQRRQCRPVHEPRRDLPEQRRGMDIPHQQGGPRRQGHACRRNPGHEKRRNHIHAHRGDGQVPETEGKRGHMRPVAVNDAHRSRGFLQRPRGERPFPRAAGLQRGRR